MTPKEATVIANKFRNAYYNSNIHEYREVALALDVLLPKHEQIKKEFTIFIESVESKLKRFREELK